MSSLHGTKRNWLLLIEAVTCASPVDGKRRKQLKNLFTDRQAGLVFVTAFETLRTRHTLLTHIAWKSESGSPKTPTP